MGVKVLNNFVNNHVKFATVTVSGNLKIFYEINTNP